MKVKATMFCLALMAAASALADDLADAGKLLENKAYPQALALYTKLANAGNPVAQFHLGEMYWYGEAGSIDLAQARHWFSKASAAGSKEAADALEVMAQRELRRKDIDYWVGDYDGKEMKSGEFDCARPEIPGISKSNADITRVEHAYAVWLKCYNGFVQNLGDALPPGKRIPQDISRLMNQIEYDQSVARLDKVYKELSQQAGDSAAAIMGSYRDWRKATEEFVAARNAEGKAESDFAVQQLQRANANISKLASPKGRTR